MREQFQRVFSEAVDIHQIQQNLGLSDPEMTTALKGHVWALACRRFLSKWQQREKFPALDTTYQFNNQYVHISSQNNFYSGELFNPNFLQSYLSVLFKRIVAKEMVLLPEPISKNIKQYLTEMGDKYLNLEIPSFSAALSFGTLFTRVLIASAQEKTSSSEQLTQIIRNSMPMVSDIAQMPILFTRHLRSVGYEMDASFIETIGGNFVNTLGLSGIKKFVNSYYKSLATREDVLDIEWLDLEDEKEPNLFQELRDRLIAGDMSEDACKAFIIAGFMKKDRSFSYALMECIKKSAKKTPQHAVLYQQLQILYEAQTVGESGFLRLKPEYFLFDEETQSFKMNSDHLLQNDEVPQNILDTTLGDTRVQELLSLKMDTGPITWIDFKRYMSLVNSNPGCAALVSLLSHGPLDASSKSYLLGMPAHTIGFLAATVLRLTDSQNPPQFA